MSTKRSVVEVRAALLDALKADLIGPFLPEDHPGGGEETLSLPPSRWYLTGFLAPKAGAIPDVDDQDSQGELAVGVEGQADDEGVVEPEPSRTRRFPASMGLSVYLPPARGETADFIEVAIRYANYDPVEIYEDTKANAFTGWKRVAHAPDPVKVPLDRERLRHPDGISIPGTVGLRIRGELRTTDHEGFERGTRVLSIFLVNERTPETVHRDRAFVFQVEMTLRYEGGFLDRSNRRGETSRDSDQNILALQFRDRTEWAVGHNTSVETPTPDPDGRVRTLRTTQLPSHEVKPMQHRQVSDVVLEMQTLSRMRDGKLLERALAPLVDAYEEWIESQRKIHLPRTPLETTRDRLVARAAYAKKRMHEGIALLRDDEQVRHAFALANEAMHLQAMQADAVREDPRYRGGAQPAWRLFQLAFVLMSLPSMADAKHPDRGTADLIYFPTGGGKTEAYLGLIAFTLILRRLRGANRPDEGRGVAVILRYTLRLLTLDQLARAATLICALEAIRRKQPHVLGDHRFSIGLWVGKSATANRLKEVHQSLLDYSPGRQDSPFPLPSCPWCGAAIKVENIKLVDRLGQPSKTKYERAVVYCPDFKCGFSERSARGEGLPVLFVDEQIYQELPDFLVATVDKFAMLPWRAEAGMLFGRITHLDKDRAYGVKDKPPSSALSLPEGLLPPELIVQDELHLISGPLGTMVGLYEAAIDYLAEREVGGVRYAPKVVCSTATVRRAREQIKALFNRDSAIFPPLGVNHGDNFFAEIAHDKPGRLYVGVGAPGRALRAVSVRTYATLLAAAQKHFDPNGRPEQPADPYMTLVGYFNSLRELGGMRRLVEDEVRRRIAQFDRGKRPHDFNGPHPWAADRALKEPAELTSRESTGRVKETKHRLAARYAAKEPEPLDVVLASSMISVGLDVDRLGLMVVTGQPKTTSEYIQATSRVGRAYPGLVVTCLNLFKPRDRSHFERFVTYHQSFYRDVEATSVTPYSGQAMERALAATMISMIRHAIPEMQPPDGVMNLHENRDAAEAILEWIIARAEKHREYTDEGQTRIAEEIRRRGRSFLDAWERVIDRAKEGGKRIYSRYDRAGEGRSLLFVATDPLPEDHNERHFQAPTSMRDVEPSVHVWPQFIPLDSPKNP